MACEFPVEVRHKLLLTAIHCLLYLLTLVANGKCDTLYNSRELDSAADCRSDGNELNWLVTHADGSCGGCLFTSVCLCIWFFSARYLKTLKIDADRITELDTEMFQDESWKPIYFGVKGQWSRSQVIKTLPTSVFVLL